MADSGIVRISGKAKETLEELSEKSGQTMVFVLDRAIEEYRRRVFLEETNLAYAKLRQNEKASKEYDRELAAWDATLMDGLEKGEAWEDGGKRKSGKKGKKSDAKSGAR